MGEKWEFLGQVKYAKLENPVLRRRRIPHLWISFLMFRDMVNYTNIRTISQPNFCTKSSRNFAIFDEIDRILWRKSQQNEVFVFADANYF